MSDRSLVALFAPPRRFDYVSIASCVRVSDSSALALSRTCARLTYLNVRGLPLLTDRGLVALLERAPCLRSLDLGAGSRSTRYWARKADSADAAEAPTRHQQRHQMLSASASADSAPLGTSQLHCEHCSVNAMRSRTHSEAGGALSDEDTRRLQPVESTERSDKTFSDARPANEAGAPLSDDQSLYTYTYSYSCDEAEQQQQQLQLQGVSDTSLVALAQHCPRLERLSICGLPRVTDEGLRWLVSAATTPTQTPAPTQSVGDVVTGVAHATPRSRLVYLDVRHCGRVTARGLRRVRALAPACVVEHTLLALSGWCEADELHERGLSADGDGPGPELVQEGTRVGAKSAAGTRECGTEQSDKQRLLITRCTDERAEAAQKLVEVNV